MFGRVSTVPIRDYLEAEYRQTGYVGGNGGAGIYLCKKFNDEYAKVGTLYYHKVSGWVDVDETTAERSYPDYDMPENLPEWVVSKEVNYFDGSIKNAKRYIIGADGCIGPFTMNEALYIYSVVKKLSTKTYNKTISVSAAGFNFEPNLNESVEYESYSPVFEPDTNDPNDLFTPALKGRTVLALYNSESDSNYDEDGYGTGGYYFVESFVGGDYYAYGNNTVSIAVDVDNLSEFYIVDFFPSLYNINIGVSGIDNSEETGDSRAGGFYGAYLGLNKIKFDVYDYDNRDVVLATLSNVGDTHTQIVESFTYLGSGVGPITSTIYEGLVNFKFGTIEKQMKAYGVISSQEFSNGESPPSVSVSDVKPTTPITIEATEFWPYKNASGQPVYNTETGAIDNSPIP